MDINGLFEGIMKAINQYADEIVAERMRLEMSQLGRGSESKGKDSENFGGRENQIGLDSPKRERVC